MIYKFLSILIVLLFAGCAGTKYMRSIQESSLQAEEDTRIERPVRLLGESEQRTMDSIPYLFTHSASIIFALTEEMYPTVEDVETEDGDVGNKIVWKNEQGPVEGEGMRGGVACPITEDGYFLTAYHVLKNRTTWMWTEQVIGDPEGGSELLTKHLLGRIRVVYADEKQDFTIVKVPYKVRHCLKIRESPLPKGEQVFGGGPWHNTGAGYIQSESSTTLRNTEGVSRYREIYTTIPLAHGDSGSPLIDKKGNLCGVNIAASSLRIWLFSVAIMADRSSIMDIIEKDRISNKALLTMSASAHRES